MKALLLTLWWMIKKFLLITGGIFAGLIVLQLLGRLVVYIGLMNADTIMGYFGLGILSICTLLLFLIAIMVFVEWLEDSVIADVYRENKRKVAEEMQYTNEVKQTKGKLSMATKLPRFIIEGEEDDK